MYQGFKKGRCFLCFSYIFKTGFYYQTHENKLFAQSLLLSEGKRVISNM